MKIGFTSIELPEGKTKYNDKVLNALAEKDKAKKVVPFFAEFIKDEFYQVEAIVVLASNILDVTINDMEKVDTRIERTEDDFEKELLQKCLKILESEEPLCNTEFTEKENGLLQALNLCSLKPVILLTGSENTDEIISLALEKADYMFFYTTGPKESHAWQIKQGSDMITCAAKIHTDLARGFIKGDTVSFENYLACHNFNDCKSKGIAKVVEKNYIVQANEIIEIRFNV
jgi:ribosome-binding ATPase